MPSLVWKTSTFAVGFVGVSYEAGLAFAVAGPVTTITVASGALPAGITISSGTDPRLIGTPTAVGVYTFTLAANDGGGAVTSPAFTLTVFWTLGDAEATAYGMTPAVLASERHLN
jgi:hypothetical protein